MDGFGGNQYGAQNRQAAEGNAGGPSMRPSAGDRRIVVLAGIGLAAIALAIVLVSLF